MHPNNFFSDVTMRSNAVVPGGLGTFLASVHPKNFLQKDIPLPVYRIRLHYTMANGNYKEAEKYAVLPPPYDNPEYVDEWLDMMADDYLTENKKDLISWGVDGIEKLGTAVLSIG